MSQILNMVKQIVGNAIKVEVKSPIQQAGKTKYPVIVTDVSQSATSGWFIQYNPTPQDNGTRLDDRSEAFSELTIAGFDGICNMILTANYYFLQGYQVETLRTGRKRASYEPDNRFRLTVVQQENSTAVTLTVKDDASPFHMLSIKFTVKTDGQGNPYIIGADKFWDRNTNTFHEPSNASFAPRKARFYRIFQQQGQAPMLRAKIAVNNNQYAINHDGTFAVDTNASAPEYVQVISSEYKALAYIYEQALMEKAFEMALAQGLPNSQPSMPGYAPNPNTGMPSFTPAFSVGNMGAPNPNATWTPAPQNPAPQPGIQQPAFQPAPAGNQQPAQTPAFPAPVPAGAGVGNGAPAGSPAPQQPAFNGVPQPSAFGLSAGGNQGQGTPQMQHDDLPWNQ